MVSYIYRSPGCPASKELLHRRSMRGRRVGGVYRCDVPSIGDIRTNVPLVSKLNIDIGYPTVSAALVHVRSSSAPPVVLSLLAVSFLRRYCTRYYRLTRYPVGSAQRTPIRRHFASWCY